MSSPSLWHLNTLSYTTQERDFLIERIRHALGEVDRDLTRELRRVQSTGFMVIVTYVQ